MKFVTWRDFAERLTISVSTLKRLHKTDPAFPCKVKISAGRVGFPSEDVERYMMCLQERGRAA